MLRLTLTIAALAALLLAACGAPSTADAPLFPGATAQSAGKNTMADALAGSFAMHIGKQLNDPAIALYAVPAETKWAEVKGFYAERLTAEGWQEEPALLVEGDTFSYAGWKKDGATLALGLVENMIGDGAYMTLASYR
ncbi:MAG: hypothetical protein RLZZ387_547 [Chloroflexota bacterium]|jgi:hypothetical protein